MSACVEWKGAFHEGYPMLGERRAHRVAYEAEHGQIPSGHVLHHTCDNKACVNPEHLRPLTPRAHMLLHRNWESSSSNKPRETCKHGHPIDGVKFIRGKPKRYCRECGRLDCRRRRSRRLAPFLPQSPTFARGLEADEEPVDPVAVEEELDG